MKKAQLVEALSRYADRRMGTMKGQDTLARFLAHYFNDLDIPADQQHDFWDIEIYVPQLLLGAFEVFRTSEDETVRQLRARYEEELGRPFPDLTDIRGNGIDIDQVLTVQSLGYLFRDAIGADWMADKIDTVFSAERHLLMQVFYKFLDRVFRRGLFEIADESPQRGMSGTFGETTLRTYMVAGRFMLTFARPGEQMEHSVSFVCGDDDPLGLGGGVQSVYTDLQTAIAMINDVMAGWPEGRSAQAEILKPDENVTIG
jgi:hypothetical protein